MNSSIDIRAQYESSPSAMATGASRAFQRVVAKHGDAAERGDLQALRAIGDAERLVNMAVANMRGSM